MTKPHVWSAAKHRCCSKRYLVADGNEEFYGQLKQALEENEKFTVVGAAADGERACELLQSCHPDVLALDLMLPKVDGIAVLKRARELEHAPAALVMTGFMTEYAVARGARDPARDRGRLGSRRH